MLESTLNFQWKRFDELTTSELYQLLRLRQQVFVVEQNCVYLDADGLDLHCFHALAFDRSERLLATARILPNGLHFAEVSIGRVATSAEARGQGHGRAVVQSALEQVEHRFPDQPIRIAAQRYLEQFYASFGFAVDSKPYLEDGIEHVEMLKRY